MRNSILIFKIKDVCYQSYFYFANALGKALSDLGFSVTYFDTTTEPLEEIDRLCGKTYRAMIDFNSMLPKLKLDSGDYLLDTINAPFYNILLDHPLYHHDLLKQMLRNYHVLCLDHNHVHYAKTCYPHLKSVSFFPMTGSIAVPSVPFEKREIPFLFTGSYTPPSRITDVIDTLPAFLKNDTMALIDLLQNRPDLTIEEATRELLADPFFDPDEPDELFPLQVQSFFLADTYQRALQREQTLSTWLREGIHVTICGSHWDEFPYTGKNLTLLPPRPFVDTFSLMQCSKIVGNLLPDFKAGVHDRVYSAMLNGAVSFTDSSTVLREEFTNEKEILYFSWKSPAQTISGTSILDLLSDQEELSKIAQAGQKKAQKNHTWNTRAALFATILSQDEDTLP